MQFVDDFTAIISDDVWRNGFGDQRFVITYGFADSLPEHQNDVQDQAFRNSFSAYSEQAKATARAAFQMWEDASSLNFIEVDADDADMVLGLFDFSASAGTSSIAGFAFFPGESLISGDVFISDESSTSLGLHLHEIGHALGLEHPFEGPLLLPPELDTRDITVMSSSGPAANALRDFDIQAIQFMYGPPSETPVDVIPAIGYSNALVSSTRFFSSIQSLTYGDSGDVTIRVTNFGERAFGAEMDVALVLSEDENVDSGDQVIGSARVGNLAAGEQSQEISITYSIFDDIAAGDYFVLIVADPTNEVAETRELDNISTLTTTSVTGVTGNNPGTSPPPFLIDPRTGERGETPPDEEPPREEPPVEEPVDPPVDEPDDPPVDEQPTDPPVDEPPTEEPVEPPTPPAPEDPNGATEGADVIAGSNAPDQIDGLGGADLLTGGGGGDTLNGGGGGDTLIGNGGRDQLTGGGGGDDLQGGGGRDLLIGNGGRDTLDGGGGKDDLQGGGGKDLLQGGGGRDQLDGGADRFIFDRGNGRDTITDFQQGRDKIVIEGGASEFSDLGVFQVGDDVMIRISNTRVLVEDDLVDNFTAADFIFDV